MPASRPPSLDGACQAMCLVCVSLGRVLGETVQPGADDVVFGVGLGLREQPTELPLSIYACRICPYRRGRSASSKSGQVDAQWLIPARHNAGCLFGHVIAAALVRPSSRARHPPVPAAAPNPACPRSQTSSQRFESPSEPRQACRGESRRSTASTASSRASPTPTANRSPAWPTLATNPYPARCVPPPPCTRTRSTTSGT
jgi:hypothetical protein